ncbi:MAG: glycosyltransferase family 2 protein [Deltaproteobacteria bacterium]|nr:glycosyltransferase family 2 protein [Deltaproteobacteria bacterium]
MQVSVIIPNWNGRTHLPVCLESLEGQTFRDFEVVLVDNGSADGSTDLVRSRYPWVKLVELPQNAGFAGANNAGLRNAAGEYVVTLNNDTRADPRWLEELVSAAESRPGIGMAASRICNYEAPDVVDSLGIRIAADGMSRGAHRRERFSSLRLARVEPILLPSACAALYRRGLLDEIGFFDEDFFAYCEDTDLGLRARLAGWDAVLARDAVVHHKYSMTGGALSPFKLYLVERNHYWVVLKTFPTRLLARVPFHSVVRYWTQASLVLGGRGTGQEFRRSEARGAAAKALLRGLKDALAGAPRMWRKRARFGPHRKIPDRRLADLLRQYRLSFRELLDAEP